MRFHTKCLSADVQLQSMGYIIAANRTCWSMCFARVLCGDSEDTETFFVSISSAWMYSGILTDDTSWTIVWKHERKRLGYRHPYSANGSLSHLFTSCSVCTAKCRCLRVRAKVARFFELAMCRQCRSNADAYHQDGNGGSFEIRSFISDGCLGDLFVRKSKFYAYELTNCRSPLRASG